MLIYLPALPAPPPMPVFRIQNVIAHRLKLNYDPFCGSLGFINYSHCVAGVLFKVVFIITELCFYRYYFSFLSCLYSILCVALSLGRPKQMQ